MPLFDTTIKNAKPGEKPYKISDSEGMYLFVHPNGGKYFRLDYRFEGKRKTLALGTYPKISLTEAREGLREARKLIPKGIDPNTHRQATKAAKAESAANSFEVIANEWLAKKTQDKSDRPKAAKPPYPWIRHNADRQHKTKDILARLRRLEERGLSLINYPMKRACTY